MKYCRWGLLDLGGLFVLLCIELLNRWRIMDRGLRNIKLFNVWRVLKHKDKTKTPPADTCELTVNRVSIMEPGVRVLLCYCYWESRLSVAGHKETILRWQQQVELKNKECERDSIAGCRRSEGSIQCHIQYNILLIHTKGGRGTGRRTGSLGRTICLVTHCESFGQLIRRSWGPNCPLVLEPAW